MNNAESNHSTRTLADIATEMKQELKEFIETRIAIFKTELGEKLAHWKIAAPLAGVGVVLLSTAYMLITLAVVARSRVFTACAMPSRSLGWRWRRRLT